ARPLRRRRRAGRARHGRARRRLRDLRRHGDGRPRAARGGSEGVARDRGAPVPRGAVRHRLRRPLRPARDPRAPGARARRRLGALRGEGRPRRRRAREDGPHDGDPRDAQPRGRARARRRLHLLRAGGDGREAWMADAHCRFLEAGSNVVSSSIVGMVDPRAHPDRALAARLDRAAKRGGVSYFTSGIEPGFMSDVLPLALSGISQHWSRIRVREILDYSTYIPTEVEKLLGDVLGFGRAMAYEPLLFAPGRLTYVWGGPVSL